MDDTARHVTSRTGHNGLIILLYSIDAGMPESKAFSMISVDVDDDRCRDDNLQ